MMAEDPAVRRESVRRRVGTRTIAPCGVVRNRVTRALVFSDAYDEDPHDDGFRLRIDPSGSVVTTRVRGRHASEGDIGTFPIDSASR